MNVIDPIRRLFDRYDGEAKSPPQRKRERWKEYAVQFPEDHENGHDACWTEAPGVWYCRTCSEWYRTWKRAPRRPQRQKDGW